MPDRAAEYASEYARIWGERGVRAWTEDWWTLPRTIGDTIGGLMNADPDTVSMHINVSSAQATIQSCYSLDSPRNKVVMMEMEFPSMLYLYREWLRDRGELVVVPTHDDITMSEDEVIEAIDDRTLIVPISHVLFRSSCIVDVRKIVDHAHRMGRWLFWMSFNRSAMFRSMLKR
jgi:kynureninase